jgi:hypothetical protein
MAAATCAVKVVSAHLTIDRGASSALADGSIMLTMVIQSTAAPSAAVPLAVASGAVSSSDPQEAKGMIGQALTLNFDDTTGVITSLT